MLPMPCGDLDHVAGFRASECLSVLRRIAVRIFTSGVGARKAKTFAISGKRFCVLTSTSQTVDYRLWSSLQTDASPMLSITKQMLIARFDMNTVATDRKTNRKADNNQTNQTFCNLNLRNITPVANAHRCTTRNCGQCSLQPTRSLSSSGRQLCDSRDLRITLLRCDWRRPGEE